MAEQAKEAELTYPVYRVWFEGFPKNHPALFVSKGKGKGHMIHAIGNVEFTGMSHAEKEPGDYDPKAANNYVGQSLLGRITKKDAEGLDELSKSIPAPPHQFNPDGPLNDPLDLCIEWLGKVENKIDSSGLWVEKFENEIMEDPRQNVSYDRGLG